MRKTKIPSQAIILVCDGRRALFMRNTGDETYPDLRVAMVMKDDPNPATHLQGTDRPGRSINHASGRHSSVEQTDWHDLAEADFAHEIATTLDRAKKEFEHLIVVAPPRTLAELRHSFTQQVKDCVIVELDKDITKLPTHEIEQWLVKELSCQWSS